jgi:hypothetical protein
MIELYVYSTMMSPGNQGVFQLLKEVTGKKRRKGGQWMQILEL